MNVEQSAEAYVEPKAAVNHPLNDHKGSHDERVNVEHSAHDHGAGPVAEVGKEQLRGLYLDLPAADRSAHDPGAGLVAEVGIEQPLGCRTFCI